MSVWKVWIGPHMRKTKYALNDKGMFGSQATGVTTDQKTGRNQKVY